MASNKGSISFIIILIIGICVYESYNNPLEEDKLRIENEKNKMIEIWSKPTIDFVENFNCSEYELKDKEIQLEKFIVVDSYTYDSCLINLNTDFEFEKYKTFNSFYTKKIEEANVIIWIVQKPGKTEGNYSNSTKAIRFCCDLNFIDKETKVIYKKITLDYLGNPPEEIRRRKGTAGGTEFFGTKPYEEILNLISQEFKTL